MRGDSARGAAADLPGDDLSKAPYFVLQNSDADASPLINLLFAGLFDLIVGRITQMGLLVPSSADGRDLNQIFMHKLPKIKEGERDRYLIGAEIMAYCKWLIYTAPFKDVAGEPRGKIHEDFYKSELVTFRDSEPTFRRRLKAQLAIWYAKHPPSRKRGSSKNNPGDDSDQELAGAKRRVVLPDSGSERGSDHSDAEQPAA